MLTESGAGAPAWMVEISLCEQFHWTEKQLRSENTTGFIRRIGLYNELQHKARKVKEGYEAAKPTVTVHGKPT